jgi:hypothetical protein
MKEVIKSKILLINPLLIVVCFVSYTARAQYGGGTGEPNDPFLIYTAEQLNEIGLHNDDWCKHFKLMGNVDLLDFDGKEGRPRFNMIAPDTNMVRKGFQRTPFTGVFDGNGHVISNFNYISTDKNRIGLFGYINDPNAQIKDLGLINSNIDGGSGYGIGSLVGENYGNITNCYVEGGSVSGYWDTGGLVGSNNGTIIDCYFAGKVSGSNGVGGLVGANYEGTISKCSSRGEVAGDFAVGGLVGDNPAFDIFSTIINCYSSSDVSGGKYVGGLAGSSGWSYPGNHFTEIKNCYSIGNVFGKENVGGLVAYNVYESGSIITSFWNIESSGQTQSDGGTGKTTSEMQTASTFLEASWDFMDETDNGTEDIWWIDEGQDYPRLWWERDDLFFLVVDDFESYNDLDPGDPASNRIFLTWIDGYDNPEINGSIVDSFDMKDLPNPTTIVHSGVQSMWYSYDNTIGNSWATANIDNLEIGPDWTMEGIGILSLWFRGYSSNAAEPMYVALANANGSSAVVYHDNPNAAQLNGWKEWTIELQEFINQGVDLTHVDTISIGLGNRNNPVAGGEGEMWFDDIRLYRPAP